MITIRLLPSGKAIIEVKKAEYMTTARSVKLNGRVIGSITTK